MQIPVTFSTCLECKKIQKNCCNDSPRVPLLIEDIERILDLGFELKDFAIAGEYQKKNLLNDEKWWQESLIKEKGRLYKINTKKTKDGSCFFLRDDIGCLLGKKRPAICKIYPFWINEKGELMYESGEKEYCYMGKLNKSLKEALALIQEDESKIQAYFTKIKQDYAEKKAQHTEIILKLLYGN